MSQPKPASEKSPYYDIAEKYGVKIDFRPFIKVESLSAKEFRQQKISVLDHTAVIFTSRHAIDHFFHLCTELRVTIPETMKYFCVTEAVALYIQKYPYYSNDIFCFQISKKLSHGRQIRKCVKKTTFLDSCFLAHSSKIFTNNRIQIHCSYFLIYTYTFPLSSFCME